MKTIFQPVKPITKAELRCSREEAIQNLINQATEKLTKLYMASHNEIEQTLGKALGYPWYKDDQKNFPGSTEKDGVCVGEHVAESIASEAANRIEKLTKENEGLKNELARLNGQTNFACECGGTKVEVQKLTKENEDNERWQREVLTDYKIPFDDHTTARRLAFTYWMFDRAQEIRTLTTRIKEVEMLKSEVERLNQSNEKVLSTAAYYENLGQEQALLEKTICELKEAFDDLLISVADRLNPAVGKSLDRMAIALSSTPSEISEKWVKREVLEKVYHIIKGTSHGDINEAITLARTELGKGEK